MFKINIIIIFVKINILILLNAKKIPSNSFHSFPILSDKNILHNTCCKLLIVIVILILSYLIFYSFFLSYYTHPFFFYFPDYSFIFVFIPLLERKEGNNCFSQLDQRYRSWERIRREYGKISACALAGVIPRFQVLCHLFQ